MKQTLISGSLILAICFAGVLVNALPAADPVPVHEYRLALSHIRVIDGDTLQANINLPLSVCLQGRIIRAAGYDAWEVRKSAKLDLTEREWIEEKSRGEFAKRDLNWLVNNSQRVEIRIRGHGKWDRWGRLVAELWTYRDGKEISVRQWMTDRRNVRK